MRFYGVDHQPIGFWKLLNLRNGFRKREVIWHFGDQQGIPTVLGFTGAARDFWVPKSSKKYFKIRRCNKYIKLLKETWC